MSAAQTCNQIKALLNLPSNWNSYGAPPIRKDLADAACAFVNAVLHDDSPLPSAVPTSWGGIQLEWHIHGIDFEVNVIDPARFSIFFDDEQTGVERELEAAPDSVDLRAIIDELTSRQTRNVRGRDAHVGR
jgi:hypothetical protein